MKKMKTLLLDVRQKELREIEIEDDLHAFYKALDVDMIELPMRCIGDKEYSIMCDEEGLLKANPIISCISETNRTDVICGSVMFFNTDYDTAELVGLTDDDIKNIREHVRISVDGKGDMHPVVLYD